MKIIQSESNVLLSMLNIIKLNEIMGFYSLSFFFELIINSFHNWRTITYFYNITKESFEIFNSEKLAINNCNGKLNKGWLILLSHIIHAIIDRWSSFFSQTEVFYHFSKIYQNLRPNFYLPLNFNEIQTHIQMHMNILNS